MEVPLYLNLQTVLSYLRRLIINRLNLIDTAFSFFFFRFSLGGAFFNLHACFFVLRAHSK